MKVVLLNLAGPLQSWAGPALMKSKVTTQMAPTDSALKGMLAACFGITREALSEGDIPDSLRDAQFTIETRQNGKIVRDFQTVGTRSDEKEYTDRIGRIFKRGAKAAPRISWPGSTVNAGIVTRTYLGDAEFFVEIRSSNDKAVEEIFAALSEPVWSPYLGRKAFSPTAPFLIGIFEEEELPDKKEEVLEWLGQTS